MFSNNNDLEFQASSSTSLQQHSVKTFAWMGLGLLITTITAFGFYSSGLALRIALQPMSTIIMFVAQFGVVIALSARLFKANISTTRALFIAYSILTGITFSTLGYSFRADTIFIAFAITTVYYTALVAIGYTTKMNLLRFGPILMVGLIILVIFNVAAMFINLDFMSQIMASAGLILFTGITAYDTQKMKAMYMQYEGDADMLSKLSMYSAFSLYLDFINIFLYILRLFGNRD